MDAPAPLKDRIDAAIALVHRAERVAARQAFDALWAELGPAGDPFHRCTLAHFMADVQDDPRDELMWDLRALEAADSLSDERVKAHHASLALRAFYPSLHLNLAADYQKLGELDHARAHIGKASAALDDLPADGYGTMIRGGIARLAAQLDGVASATS